MALKSTRTVVLGTFSFMVFWVLAVFPSFKFLPIGRTAGALAGAVLTVVFQVESPSKAYDSVNLSILGLLFGTMVVSLYLENADMFQYLGNLLSWKCRGGKDLLCRVCVLSAVASALFTNDTCCLVLTEFVLKLCRQKNLPPKPFLIALAACANIGSAATPIGNPQNLVIAVQSGISFGRFLIGLLPSMVLGVLVNIILMLLFYWRQLSPVEDLERGLGISGWDVEGKDQVTASPWMPFDSECRKGSGGRSLHETPSDGYDKNDFPRLEGTCEAQHSSIGESHQEDNIASLQESDKHGFPSLEGTSEAQRSPIGQSHQEDSVASLQESASTHESYGLRGVNTGTPHRQTGFDGLECASPLPSASISPSVKPDKDVQSHSTALSRSLSSSSLSEEKETVFEKWRRLFRKCAAYLVTAVMLAALLYGLNLSWTALTAAVALMVLDFRDAGSCLDKVSYPLLAFFSGMFITVDGFNQTGIPGTFWDAVEPHARINSTSGIIILALVVIVLSNVASNVPTGTNGMCMIACAVEPLVLMLLSSTTLVA